MWKTPVVCIVDLAEYALFAASSFSVACDRISCC